MLFPAGETVTVHHVGPSSTTDRWGNPLPGAATDETVPGCAVWQTAGNELLSGQDRTVTRMRVVLDPAVAVAVADEVTARGTRYLVDGEPARYRSPFTGAEVLQVDLVGRT